MAASLERVFALLLVICCNNCGYARLEQGSFDFQLNKDDRIAVIEKSVYINTRIYGRISCDDRYSQEHPYDHDPSSLGKVLFYVLWFPCAKDFYNLFPKGDFQLSVEDFTRKIKYGSSVYRQEIYLQLNFTKGYDYRYYSIQNFPGDLVLTTERKGGTHFFILYYSFNSEAVSKDLSGYLDLQGPDGGYLSKTDWPLLPFYGTMVALYAVCGIVWCALMMRYMCCGRKTGVWVQGCIALILTVGIVEYAVFLADVIKHYNWNRIPGAEVSAEVMSSIKRTISAVVGILISLGFGVVRPPCGAMLAKVLGVGALYLSLATAECCVRVLIDNEVAALSTSIPLMVLDVAICGFILSYLGKTIAELGITKNKLELYLYKHFRNMLIFAAAVSAGYYIWILSQEQLAGCLGSNEVWLKDGVWHILFFIVLLSAMVIWRPTVKYNRSDYSPLPKDDSNQDNDDDDRLLDINTDNGTTGKQNTTDDLNIKEAKHPGGDVKTESQCGGFKATMAAIMEGVKDKFKNDTEVRAMKKEKMQKDLEKADLELENIKLENKFLSLKIEKLQPQEIQLLVQPEAELSECTDEAEQTGGLDAEDVPVHQYSAQ